MKKSAIVTRVCYYLDKLNKRCHNFYEFSKENCNFESTDSNFEASEAQNKISQEIFEATKNS